MLPFDKMISGIKLYLFIIWCDIIVYCICLWGCDDARTKHRKSAAVCV